MSGRGGAEDLEQTYRRVQAVRDKYEIELMSKVNVVGVGIGLRMRGGESTGEIALIVMVTDKVPSAELSPEDVIPAEIDGVPIDVHAVGELRADA